MVAEIILKLWNITRCLGLRCIHWQNNTLPSMN
uniref:Uncharacterized protein n=1 Tax=Anguilla anguilla TaxID=7936 RepID=A0A0E9W9E4_ANGAN